MAESGDVAIGFEGLETGDGQKSYTIKFSSSDPEPEAEETGSPNKKSEEIGLIDRSESPSRKEDAEEVDAKKEQTVFFEDGERRIDFVLAFQITVEKKQGGFLGFCKKNKEDTEASQDKRNKKRETFIENCKKLDLEFELQDCAESPDRKTYFYKVHATQIALLRGAEELFLRMPVEKNTLSVASWRQRFFDFLKIKDPMEPTIPPHLQRDRFFTAPFVLEKKERFKDWDKDDFFTNAQRSSIVWHILQIARYGEDEDQIGIPRLLQNKTFTCAYPIHEGSYKFDKKTDDPATMTDRQLLRTQWSSPRAFYKKQPLDQIRRYFGEKVGIYFAWLGFYTMWLLPASLVGIIAFIYGLSTINTIDFRNPIANATCDESNRYDLYMCPRCDERCAFWFLTDSCSFNYVAQLFDNAATVAFAIFMSFWAVLFLEFWKRKQYYLQFDWDVLDYEDISESARPEFEQRIKKRISACKSDKAKQRYYYYNEVLDKNEYIQPAFQLWPKLLTTFSILGFMAGIVLAVVVAVLVYRLVVAASIYVIVSEIQFGPSVGDIAVSISGAVIQLLAILILNKIYEWLAYKLTSWELQRTKTDFEDSFIIKMYIFQFFNFYSSLFYIAFFKGNVSGYPGNYNRIGFARLDECATYGCLLELTIQLGIIFLGKQILSNATEIGLPYFKRFMKWVRHEEETDEDIYTRWEKDYDLVELSTHGLFFEYLELVIQYGFVTLFVAAFPLAPLFALLNNYFEIRIDAHKFVSVFRRPVAERAQDIGAWFGILTIIGQLSVITNAFIIVVTSQFVPQVLFQYTTEPVRLNEYVEWSLTTFDIDALVDGEAFPSYNALNLNLADDMGEDIVFTNMSDPNDPNDGLNYKYLPFVNETCIGNSYPNVLMENTTINGIPMFGFIKNDAFRNAYVESVFNYSLLNGCRLDNGNFDPDCFSRSPPKNASRAGECYQNAPCKFRGFVPGLDDRQSLKYWQLQTARLGFVIVFEHLIFVISYILAFLVPDVPQSVKNQIIKEKLIAATSISQSHEASGIVGRTEAELEKRRADDGGRKTSS